MKPASIVLMMVLTMAFGAQAEVTFQVDFNRATAGYANSGLGSGGRNDPCVVADVAQPVIAKGDPTVKHVATIEDSQGRVLSQAAAGYYAVPWGAWGSPGMGFYNPGCGIQYAALDNISRERGTIEWWTNKSNFFRGASAWEYAFWADWAPNNTLYFLAAIGSGATDLRFWLHADGTQGDTERLSVALAQEDLPTGADTPDGQGWNHFLLSYDLSNADRADNWIGLWLNGERIGHLTGTKPWGSSVTTNTLTLGNSRTLGTHNRWYAAMDAFRAHDVPVHEVYVMGPDYGNPADDPNLVKDPNNFRVPGLPGAEYATRENHVTFLADFNTPDLHPEVVCTPSISAGSSEVTLLGTVRPGIDTEPRGTWGTLGVGLYAEETGLHYEAVNNVPRNQGTIEMYASLNPTTVGAGQIRRVLQAFWHGHYYIDVSVHNGDFTDTTATIRSEARMGYETHEKMFPNYFSFDKASWPFSDSGTSMNLWAVSWKGSSASGVADGWLGLWINGVLLQKVPVSQPYFWYSSTNKLAISIHSNGTSHRMGGTTDAVRVSVLPVPELYDVDEDWNYAMPGYSGNEYGPKPQVCGDPGTPYARSDINQDCRVDLLDVALLASQWLECTDPAEGDCW